METLIFAIALPILLVILIILFLLLLFVIIVIIDCVMDKKYGCTEEIDKDKELNDVLFLLDKDLEVSSHMEYINPELQNIISKIKE